MNMKLLVVLSIKEYLERVGALLHDAGVKRFSVADITGYKKKKENFGWFASDSAQAKTNSIILFSFLPEEVAHNAIAEIDSCNVETQNPFPVHAFLLDVEQFSKII